MSTHTQGESERSRFIRLRYAGTCRACGLALRVGWRAHHFPSRKQVQCTRCGLHSLVSDSATPPPPEVASSTTASEMPQLAPAGLPTCSECGRRLEQSNEARVGDTSTGVCLECVALATVGVVGNPGEGARREQARREASRQHRVRTRHPLLGPIALALTGEPQHIKAWKRGAVGEERFGKRLSRIVGPNLKVLHDRRVPYSPANVDHLVVTARAAWVLDTKRYKGRLEVRSAGWLSPRKKDLYLGGRKQNQLLEKVEWQIGEVAHVLVGVSEELHLPAIPVRSALGFVDAEIGFLSGPWTVDGIEVTWGSDIRKLLSRQRRGPLPTEAVAKRLARFMPAG